MTLAAIAPTAPTTTATTEAAVVVRGEIDLATAPELRALLIELIHDEVQRVSLDFSDVTFIDSAGLGVLIGALRRLVANVGDQASLEISNPTGPVRRVFQITGLDTVFRVVPGPRAA